MGVYIHVPFCHSKCVYCGFYSTVSPLLQNDWCEALELEASSRGSSFSPVIKHSSLYVGGGTPSLLPEKCMERVLFCADKNFMIKSDAERTIEVNPEDVSLQKVHFWRNVGFNRISIGVQSFDDRILKKASRRHTVEQAERAIEIADTGGFGNISVDLIIGLGGKTGGQEPVSQNVARLVNLPISHISIYALSIEPGSILYKKIQKGEFEELPDDQEALMYIAYSEALESVGFSHYEVSNYAKDGKESVHNNLYWSQAPYVGLGPAAHSYDGDKTRRWNIADIRRYIERIREGEIYYEKETLSPADRYNEIIMTRLRRKTGISAELLHSDAVAPFWEKMSAKAETYVESGHAIYDSKGFRLTKEGWLISDSIFRELFVDEE